jgi:agmatinase
VPTAAYQAVMAGIKYITLCCTFKPIAMIKLLGLPYDCNSSFLKGPSLAPPRIRLMDKDGSANAAAENGMHIIEGETYTDAGDIVFNNCSPADAFSRIKQAVATHLLNGDKLLCLGGDHSVTYPIIDAFTQQYNNLHILHIDAHADLYENLDDNPYSHASPFARIMEQGKVQSLTQVGIRTLNTPQKRQAEKFGVQIIEMKNFNFDFLQNLQGPLYISLDLDVLDPAFAPGISHHEPGGLTTRELIKILQSIHVPVAGADIVEYNPVRDVNNVTAMVAYKLFKELVALMLNM